MTNKLPPLHRAIVEAWRIRTGSTKDHAAYTGEPREMTFDTDRLLFVLHDGETKGGARFFEVGDILKEVHG